MWAVKARAARREFNPLCPPAPRRTPACSLPAVSAQTSSGLSGPSWVAGPWLSARGHSVLTSRWRLESGGRAGVGAQPPRELPAPPSGFLRRGRCCPCQDRVGRPENIALQKNEFRGLPKDPLRFLVICGNDEWSASICTQAAGPEHGHSACVGRRSSRDSHTHPGARSPGCWGLRAGCSSRVTSRLLISAALSRARRTVATVRKGSAPS